jgi:putative molybdopterin biosynthesis protein
MSANQVRAVRERQAIPQGRLALAAGLSRQALSSIEAGRASPSVEVALRIASALSSSVEELFGENTGDTESVDADLDRTLSPGDSVLVGWIGDRWVGHDVRPDTSARSIDGVVTAAKRVALHRQKAELVDAVFIAGCAPALGALAERAQRKTGTLFRWLSRSSGEALKLLSEERIQVGGIHLESNATAVKKKIPRVDASLITFASWEVGLAMKRGSRAPRTVAELVRSKARIAWREPGSGAHALALRLLREAQAPIDDVNRRATGVRTHLAVAQAVEAGFVDVGFTIKAAALACGLDFVPLAKERFDLVISSAVIEDRRIRALLDVVSDAGFRLELQASGYDATNTGARIAA